MDLDFCELFSPLDFFGQGGTLGRASAERPLVADSPVGIHWFGFTSSGFSSFRDSPVGFSSRIHQCARRAGLEAGPRVGTSESGAQPPVGRTKNISHVLCFDVASGVTSEETRLANFYFRTFFRDLVARHPCPRHLALEQKPCLDPVKHSPATVIIPALLS
jgi:hypothetical protein